jgi:ribosomal protein L12E/L44/L45/RPP1/RPP2
VPLLAPLSFRLGVSRDAEEALYAALQQMGQLVLDPAAAAAEAAAQRAREEHEAKEEEERRKKAQAPPVTQPKPTARK